MALTFRNVEPKTGELLAPAPDRVAHHTYLEQRLKQAQKMGAPPQGVGLYVANLYEGVSAADLEHLKSSKSLYCIGSNRRSAYFVDDAATAQWVQETIFTNLSDPVAYFSVAMSDALASTTINRARVLVIDDGVPSSAGPTRKWGRRKPKDRQGNSIDGQLLEQAHPKLGDGYCLISPSLHRQVSRTSAVYAAHEAVDAGRIALAQVHSIAADEIHQGVSEDLKTLVAVQLEEAIEVSLPTGGGAAKLEAGSLRNLRSGVQVVMHP